MKMRILTRGALLGISLSSLGSATLFAETLVQQLDADTLRVIEYKGKPPYKRMTISQTSNPRRYAHYADLISYDPQPLFTVERRGAPGKSLPRQARRISGEEQEVAQFARFEETDEATGNNGRQWRGAPGKSRPISR